MVIPNKNFFKFISSCQKILEISLKNLFPSNFFHFFKISFEKEISFKVEALIQITAGFGVGEPSSLLFNLYNPISILEWNGVLDKV